MLFTSTQIQDILYIIEKNHLIYAGVSIGFDVLSEYDKRILKDSGIDIDKISRDWTPFEQSFYFGRLSQLLNDQQVKKLKYNDFVKYLKKGQYIPLNSLEKDMLSIAKQRSYRHIKNLGRNIGEDVNGMVFEEDKKLRMRREKVTGKELERGIQERNSLSTIVREIGKKTGDWQRNLGRIVDTEFNTVMQEGRASQILREGGEEARVYKIVYPGACRHCIRLYLTGGIGSKPKVFLLKEIIDNGSNIGRKVAEWKPVVESTHPYCRCNLYHLEEGKEWNEETGRFEYPEKYETHIERKSKVKVMVGDKEFLV